jgi:hypothetical protein
VAVKCSERGRSVHRGVLIQFYSLQRHPCIQSNTSKQSSENSRVIPWSGRHRRQRDRTESCQPSCYLTCSSRKCSNSL